MTETLILSLAGIAMNLAFGGVAIQPDWAFAALLAAILAHRGNWVWALPVDAVHDLALHWSLFATLPALALVPLAMMELDRRLGPGLPQRVFLALAASMALPHAGWSLPAWLLTLLLIMPLWRHRADRHA